jgi:hypothetical protein
VTDELVEPAAEPRPPDTTHEAISPDAELARRNAAWGWALFGVFLLLFGGTVGVALIYLALD